MSAAPSRKSGGFSALDTFSRRLRGAALMFLPPVSFDPPPDHTSGRSTEEKEAS